MTQLEEIAQLEKNKQTQILINLFSDPNICVDSLKHINLDHINNILDKSNTNQHINCTPLHVLCMNPNLTPEIIKYIKDSSNGNFENYILIELNNKQIYVCPLTLLCENQCFNSYFFELVSEFNFAPKDLTKHKKHSPIFTLCGNKNITFKMLETIHDSKNNIYQKSAFDNNITSFNKLFSNDSINIDIVKFIFSNYELNILFTKSAIINLLSNPKIDFEILSYLHDRYKRLILDNFVTILTNPKIIELNLMST